MHSGTITDLDHAYVLLQLQQDHIDDLRQQIAVLRVERDEARAVRSLLLEHGCQLERLVSLLTKGVWA